MIDIVVSVYNAYDSVDKCLFFLSKHSKEASQIVLINDASTDDKIKILAKKYCKKYSWKYLENKQNLGFVKTANKGLKFSKNHTILLNSDAFVCYGWLNGFVNLLETQNDIGTATAWSNNAEIVSFPNTLKFNQPIENTNEFGGWLINNYKASYPEIPTAE